MSDQHLTIGYTNWRGEWALRRIVPIRVWFGSTEWHPKEQWLLRAMDLDKRQERDFALAGFGDGDGATARAEAAALARMYAKIIQTHGLLEVYPYKAAAQAANEIAAAIESGV